MLLVRIVVRVFLGLVDGALNVIRGGVDGVELYRLGTLVDEVVPLASWYEDGKVVFDYLVDVQVVLVFTNHDAALAGLEAQELVMVIVDLRVDFAAVLPLPLMPFGLFVVAHGYHAEGDTDDDGHPHLRVIEQENHPLGQRREVREIDVRPVDVWPIDTDGWQMDLGKLGEIWQIWPVDVGDRCRFGVVGTASPRSWYRGSTYPVLQGGFLS